MLGRDILSNREDSLNSLMISAQSLSKRLICTVNVRI